MICQQVIMTVHHLTGTLRALRFQSFKLILAVISFITTDCEDTEKLLPPGMCPLGFLFSVVMKERGHQESEVALTCLRERVRKPKPHHHALSTAGG